MTQKLRQELMPFVQDPNDPFPGQDGLTIQEQFERFHKLNPWVYEELVAMTRLLVSRGHSQIGMGHLFEVLRWKGFLQTNDPSGWKLNNNYRSRYARLIQGDFPKLGVVFETRALKSA